MGNGIWKPRWLQEWYRHVSVSCTLGFGLSHQMNFGNESKLRLEDFSRISPFFFFFPSCSWKFHSVMNFSLSKEPLKNRENQSGENHYASYTIFYSISVVECYCSISGESTLRIKKWNKNIYLSKKPTCIWILFFLSPMYSLSKKSFISQSLPG